jgi:hypothetical protein
MQVDTCGQECLEVFKHVLYSQIFLFGKSNIKLINEVCSL